jgi:co-chaperonin GroES (HSP10)
MPWLIDCGEKTMSEVMQEFDLDANLPHPVGYHILVMMPTVEETFGGTGLVKAESTKHQEAVLSMVAAVLEIGDMAYKDQKRFPTGPWCKVGDYIMFRTHSGTRFRVNGQEYRLINDDSVEAVVPNPRAISRA